MRIRWENGVMRNMIEIIDFSYYRFQYRNNLNRCVTLWYNNTDLQLLIVDQDCRRGTFRGFFLIYMHVVMYISCVDERSCWMCSANRCGQKGKFLVPLAFEPRQRKPVFGVCNEVWLKPVFRSIILSRQRTTKVPKKTARMRRLICTFIVRIWRKQVFSQQWGSFYCLAPLKDLLFTKVFLSLSNNHCTKKFVSLYCILQNPKPSVFTESQRRPRK